MKKILTALFLLFLPILAIATAWQIVPQESSLTFTATQNNSPVSGQFKSFTGEINFDPNQLNSSSINIVVDMGSVTTSYKEVADTLKTPDWFDVKSFPKATFKASQFTKTADKTYQATGNLTIRDKSIPITLSFVLDKYTSTKAHVTGSTTLKRTAFAIGKGDWAKTDDVKDDVKVNFILSASKK